MYRLIDESRMPVLGKLPGGSLRFANAETVFPTATFAAQASGLTGVYPCRHGIMSNMWMDRRGEETPVYDYTGSFFDAAKVYRYNLIGFPTLVFADTVETGLADSHLSDGVKTIYQAAAENNLTSVTAFHQFEKGASRRVRPRPSDMIRYFFGNYFPGQFEVFDESMTTRLITDMQEHGTPDIIFIYFAPADGTDHWQGEKGQEKYLEEVINFKLERIIEFIKEKREPDSTLYVVYGDHGHSDVSEDKEHCISVKWMSSVIGSVPGFERISHHSARGKDALIAPEGGMAAIYLKKPGCPNWGVLPDEEICRKTAENFIREGNGRLGAVAYRTGESLEYRLLAGNNPMNINTDAIISKINREYRHINAPDVMLFSNYSEGWHFYKQPLMATHGNINPGDLEIPVIFYGKGIKSKIDTIPVQIVDIAPTIASAMGFSMDNTDGKVLNIKE
ncbi:MAG: alkaline phosphatase family protein [Firmicutes bacterium]|nr:alkaline phosphatase family protein [Bacillota bacterium]